MQDFEFFLCIFLYHFVFLEVLVSLHLRKFRWQKPGDSCSAWLFVLSLFLLFYMGRLPGLSKKRTKWYKNMHKKNSKSCINPESGEYHYSSLKMWIIVCNKKYRKSSNIFFCFFSCVRKTHNSNFKSRDFTQRGGQLFYAFFFFFWGGGSKNLDLGSEVKQRICMW